MSAQPDHFDRVWEQRALEGAYEDPPPRTDSPLVESLWTARDFCELEVPPSEELIGPLLHRGARLVLAGAKGEGKTTFTFQAIKAAVLGEEFLGWQVVGGRTCLILDAEQGHRTVKRRLEEAGLGRETRVHILHRPAGLQLDKDPHHRGDLEEILTRLRPDIVVLDPLYKLHGGDSNSEREAVDLMRVVDRWREDLRFGLIIPMHTRKVQDPRRPFTISDIYGNGAWVRGAETAVGLQRISPGYARLHFFADRDDLEIGARWGLIFNRDDGGFRRDPGQGKPSTQDQVREMLLGAAPERLSIESMVEALGKERSTVSKALKKIGASSATVEGGGKVWWLEEDSPPSDEEVERLKQMAMDTGGGS